MAEKPEGLKAQWEQFRILEESSLQVGAFLSPLPEAASWMRALELQFRELGDELAWMAPWLAQAEPEDAFWESTGRPEERQALAELHQLRQKLLSTPTLREVANLEPVILSLWKPLVFSGYAQAQKSWLEQFKSLVLTAATDARDAWRALEKLAQLCQASADMDYDFLYDSAGICCPSATMSANAAGTTVFTTCWPPKPGWGVLWPLPRGT